jgi:hypothetical protein
MSREASQPGNAPSSVDDAGVAYRTVHEWDSHETLSDTVVRAVSKAAGVDPMELPAPVIDSVDPDALDALFRPRHDGTARPSGGRIEFATNDYDVVVHSDGRVFVYEQEHA